MNGRFAPKLDDNQSHLSAREVAPKAAAFRFGADDGKACCDHCGGELSLRRGHEMRCGCGNLLARLVAGGVEVKCRRCKRTVVLPVEKESRASSG